MTEEKRKPTYYAVLPAEIRYADDLSDFEKILYAEFTALTDKESVCWAGNEYFARLYRKSEKHISRIIGSMARKQYISIELDRGGNTGGGERRIYLEKHFQTIMPRKKCAPTTQKCGVGKETEAPTTQKCGFGTLLNNNNTKEYIVLFEKEQFSLFETIWKTYPIKSGKKKASACFKSSVKNTEDWKNIQIALSNYLTHLALPENKWKRPQVAKTWFNNWQDWIDWKEPEKPEDREAIAQVEKNIQAEIFQLQEKIGQIEAAERPNDRLEEKTRTQKRILVREKELGLIQSGKWTIETWLSYQMLLNERRLRQAQKIGTPDLDVEIKKLFAMEGTA